jgi:hypothetical protein
VANASGSSGVVGSVGVLLGNGDGTFQTATSYDSGGTDADTNSIGVADVNGDGKLDLLTVNVNGNSRGGGSELSRRMANAKAVTTKDTHEGH